MALTVAITGATAGFGIEIARIFAVNPDTKLILIGRRKDRLQELAAETGEKRTYPLACDICDTDGFNAALKSLPENFADIDVLVNNAGLGLGTGLAQESDMQDWMVMVDTNIKGLLAGTHAVLPGMVSRNRGHIVNIGSVIGEFPAPRMAVYGGTKAFVRHFSLCLRADLHGTSVRVTDVEPGIAGGTEFSVVRTGGDEEGAKAFYQGYTSLNARDVAEAVYWAVNRPDHVNVNTLQLVPTAQSFGPMAIAKG